MLTFDNISGALRVIRGSYERHKIPSSEYAVAHTERALIQLGDGCEATTLMREMGKAGVRFPYKFLEHVKGRAGDKRWADPAFANVVKSYNPTQDGQPPKSK